MQHAFTISAPVYGSPPPKAQLPKQRARYDAAQTTDENRKHWANADDLSPNAAHSYAVRQTLRKRSRYEYANNSYLRGLITTLSNDMVGTGPRLQLTIPGVSRDVTRIVERQFFAWGNVSEFADKLRVMHEARIRDGESFATLGYNDGVKHRVKLDVWPVEADQVTTPDLSAWNDPWAVDGIKFDENGNPLYYTILKYHPGDTLRAWPRQYDKYEASKVLHWYRPDRPGQARGVPEITAALPLFAQMRRYTLAVIGAAEIAAMIAGVMYTDSPADDGATPSIEAMDRVEFERNALLTLPRGWRSEQFDAKQPVSTYPQFKAEILNEIGRSVGAPFNVVAGNSSGYNYSSGRLDHIPYQRNIWIERERFRHRVLDRTFHPWAEEYRRIASTEGLELPDVSRWSWEWQWDGFDSADPQKDAQAIRERLELNLTTLAEECAAQGRDWSEVLRQRAVEKQIMDELGLTQSPPQPTEPAGVGDA